MKFKFKALLFGSAKSDSMGFEIAYTLFRFYCGVSIALGAGLSKVFHKVDEHGGEGWDNLAFGVPDWFVKQVGEIGFTFISPGFWAILAVYGEFIGGLCIALGLLTRISALQMAFQFFVVSFIWYDEPMPFAMYYQQLIFWAFVLIAAMGSGPFALHPWLSNFKTASQKLKKSTMTAVWVFVAISGFGQSAITPERISFTLSNPTIKKQLIEIQAFDETSGKTSGYGYGLGALRSHAVNMPIGTRVYLCGKQGKQLIFVLSATDQGRKFDTTQKYEITEAQRNQVARDEQNQKIAQNNKVVADPDLKTLSNSKGYEMIDFLVSGKTFLGRQIKVRAQLPFDAEKSNVGFSQRLSKSSKIELSYPVGTKIYLCEGDYWLGDVRETLLFTVDASYSGKLLRI